MPLPSELLDSALLYFSLVLIEVEADCRINRVGRSMASSQLSFASISHELRVVAGCRDELFGCLFWPLGSARVPS